MAVFWVAAASIIRAMKAADSLTRDRSCRQIYKETHCGSNDYFVVRIFNSVPLKRQFLEKGMNFFADYSIYM